MTDSACSSRKPSTTDVILLNFLDRLRSPHYSTEKTQLSHCGNLSPVGNPCCARIIGREIRVTGEESMKKDNVNSGTIDGRGEGTRRGN